MESLVITNPAAWYKEGYSIYYTELQEKIKSTKYVGLATSADGFNFKRVHR